MTATRGTTAPAGAGFVPAVRETPAPFRSTAPRKTPLPDTAAPPRFPRRGGPSVPVRPAAPHKTPVPTPAHPSPRAIRVHRSPR